MKYLRNWDDTRLEHRVEEFLRADAEKLETLRDYNRRFGFPIEDYHNLDGLGRDALHSYLENFPFDSCVIRAVLKQGFLTSLPFLRRIGISRRQCSDFVEELGSKREQYSIFVTEFFEAEYSGSIISGRLGIYAEIVKGLHSELTQGWASQIYSCEISFPHRRAVYSTEDRLVRQVMWGAIAYLFGASPPCVGVR